MKKRITEGAPFEGRENHESVVDELEKKLEGNMSLEQCEEWMKAALLRLRSILVDLHIAEAEVSMLGWFAIKADVPFSQEKFLTSNDLIKFLKSREDMHNWHIYLAMEYDVVMVKSIELKLL